jgi:hypothetical protein
MIFINLPLEDWDMITMAIDYRLYALDQEYHFFEEEYPKEYYQLIEIRDYILSFTDEGNLVESKNPPGEV